MKVICEYCKNTFDSEKNNQCPTCGADISNNEMIKENIKIENERDRIVLEQQKTDAIRNKEILESQRRGTQFVRILKIGCLIPFILMIILIVISISMAIKEIVTLGQDDTENIDTENKIQEVMTQGNLNEPVSTSTYSVTCNGYEEFEKYSKPTNGYKYMRFHFTIENISDETIYSDEALMLLVNGVQCERARFSDVKKLKEAYIIPGAKIDGYIGFEVPENASNVEIKYGEYITIYVDIK